VTDEGTLNPDWNPVWDVRTARFDGGWSVEMVIPFKSLSLPVGRVAGVGRQRSSCDPPQDEWTHLTPVPASFGVPGGMLRLSVAGTLTGLDLPPASRNVELKPYGISRLTTDRLATPARLNDGDATGGFDVKYGITANVTADLTVNTDFAQVEVDEQQVNLTRFALSFPEKRDFSSKAVALFDFGRGAPGVGGSVPAVTPTLFYSRRIGLNGSRVVPIEVGGRVTGKVGKTSLGLMNIQTGEDPFPERRRLTSASHASKRDVLRRSSVGLIVTNRSASGNRRWRQPGLRNRLNVFVLPEHHDGRVLRANRHPRIVWRQRQLSRRFEYGGDRYGARADYMKVGDHFKPRCRSRPPRRLQASAASLRSVPAEKAAAIGQEIYVGRWIREFRQRRRTA